MKMIARQKRNNRKMAIGIAAAVVAAIILAIALVALRSGEKPLHKSPNQIYDGARDSVFFVEAFCKGFIDYPYFNFTWRYEPSEDTIYFDPAPTSDWSTFHMPGEDFALSVFFGSGFAANGRLYTNAHLLNCSDQALADIFYSSLDQSLSIVRTLPEENATAAILLTENTTDYPINYFSEYMLGEIIRIYGNTSLRKEDIALTMHELLLEHIRDTLGAYNATYANISVVRSTESLDDLVFTDVVEMGVPWPGRDYAILKLPDAGVKGLTFRDSDNVKVGDKVYVMGYPSIAAISETSLLEPTLTQGIASAIKVSEIGEKYIQIDAASSAGNSGGPVFNEQGEVIGILTAGAGESFTFVFPSNSIPRN